MSEFKKNYGICKNFKPYYDKGWNDSKIAKELGCDNATVTQWRHRNNLSSNYKKKGTKKDKILSLYHKGLSKSEIVDQGPSSYKYTMSVLSHLPDQNKFDDINNTQKSRIIGTLLGDGSVNKRFTFSFAHKHKYREYTIYKAEKINLSYNLSEREQYRKGTKCKSSVATFHSHPYFNKLRNIFYPNDNKIFPLEYVKKYFTWESLAYWYLDDGTISSNSSYTLAICSLKSQSKEISNFLENKFSISTNIHKGGKLYIPVSEKKKFTKGIIKYVPNCMKYKVLNK